MGIFKRLRKLSLLDWIILNEVFKSGDSSNSYNQDHSGGYSDSSSSSSCGRHMDDGIFGNGDGSMF